MIKWLSDSYNQSMHVMTENMVDIVVMMYMYGRVNILEIYYFGKPV